MITDKDMDKLLGIFPTKSEVHMIVDNAIEKAIDEKIIPFQQEVLTALDKIASKIDAQNLPNAARDAQLTRHDQWINKMSDKTGVELKG